MKIMKFRCPCRQCIVSMICKEPCDLFYKFIKPVDQILKVLENFFGAIDDMITEPSRLQKWFDKVGLHIIGPVIFHSVTFIFGMKTAREGQTLFNKRYGTWEDENKQ